MTRPAFDFASLCIDCDYMSMAYDKPYKFLTYPALCSYSGYCSGFAYPIQSYLFGVDLDPCR